MSQIYKFEQIGRGPDVEGPLVSWVVATWESADWQTEMMKNVTYTNIHAGGNNYTMNFLHFK